MGMKNIFDYNIDTEEHDGSAFYSRRISANIEKQSEQASTELVDLYLKSTKTLPSIIVESVCALIITMSIVAFVVSLLENGKKPYGLIITAIISAIICLVIELKTKKKEKQSLAQIEEKDLKTELENLEQSAMDELGIPEERYEIEVLCDLYQMKKGKKKKAVDEFCDQMILTVYAYEKQLCFFDGRQELAIPFSDIKEIEIMKEKKRILDWLKDISYKDKKYKKYKVYEANMGLVIGSYYRIVIESVWGTYEILIPNYEEEIIQNVIKKALQL